jgi:hypothetical protein
MASCLRVTDETKIVRLGPLYFFPLPIPPGAVSKLKPEHPLATDLMLCGSEPYFAVLIAGLPTPDDEEVRDVLEQTWSELYDRSAVDSPTMPEIVDGHPAAGPLPVS